MSSAELYFLKSVVTYLNKSDSKLKETTPETYYNIYQIDCTLLKSQIDEEKISQKNEKEKNQKQIEMLIGVCKSLAHSAVFCESCKAWVQL